MGDPRASHLISSSRAQTTQAALGLGLFVGKGVGGQRPGFWACGGTWLALQLLVALRAAAYYRRQVPVCVPETIRFSSCPCRRRPGSSTAGPGPAIFDPLSLLRPDGSRLRPRNWYSWL